MWDTWLYLVLLGLSAAGYALSFSSLTLTLRWAAVHQMVTTAVTTLAVLYIYAAKQYNNLFLFHWLTALQYGSIATMYAYALPRKKGRRVIFWSVPLFIGLSLLLASTIQPWHEVNSYSSILFNVLIACLSGTYIRSLFINQPTKRIEREPLFWISVGLFFTSLGNFFVQGLLNYLLQQSRQAALAVYWVEELMGMILTGMFIVALLVYKRWLFST